MTAREGLEHVRFEPFPEQSVYTFPHAWCVDVGPGSWIGIQPKLYHNKQ